MMHSLFVFGTLLHAPLLHIVAGEKPDTDRAVLPDHAFFAVRGAAFPALRPVAGAQAEGLLLAGLSDAALARLDFYEGIFGYARQEVTVLTGAGPVITQIYRAPEDRWQVDGPWSLEDWTARHAETNCLAAHELMQRRGKQTPEALAEAYGYIRARAWAQAQAARSPAPTEVRRTATPGDVVVAREDAAYDGFFRLKTFDVSGRQFQGRMGPVLSRECFVAFDAALVLPYDPVTDRVLVVEQLRFGPLWRNDPQPWTLEPIAGMIDAGESPEETARREAREEAGLEVTELRPIAGVYPAPGYVTEYYHCFLALMRLDGSEAGIGGLASESENIRSHVLAFDAAMALVDSGEINVAPLQLMLLWLARQRADLRRAAAG